MLKTHIEETKATMFSRAKTAMLELFENLTVSVLFHLCHNYTNSLHLIYIGTKLNEKIPFTPSLRSTLKRH